MNGSGKWARGAPLALAKGGAHFNTLQELDAEHCCPITFSMECAAGVRAEKAERKER